MKTLSSCRFFAFITMLYLFGCQLENYIPGDPPDISEYNWGTEEKIWIEDGHFHSFKIIDTLKNELAGDSLTPLTFYKNNKVIISQLTPTRMDIQEEEGGTNFLIKKAKFVSDTFTYDIKKYIGKTFLILFSEKVASKIYELKTEDTDLNETDHIKQPELEVNGYKVGQSVQRDKINIIYTDNFGASIIEEATLKTNQDVILTLVGRQYIEQIQRINITEDEFDSIKKRINDNFSVDGEYEEIKNGRGILEQTIKAYYWDEKEVSVSLKKVIPNPDHNNAENEDGWTLHYENFLITHILQNYLKPSREPI